MTTFVENLRAAVPTNPDDDQHTRVSVPAAQLRALLDVVEAAQAWDMAGYGPGSERADKALIDAIMRLWRLR